MKNFIKPYLKEVEEIYQSGEAKEHAYRTPFEELLKKLGEGIRPIQEPEKSTDVGIPDFKVKQHNLPVGHIECKDIGTPLDDVLETEQLKKYLRDLPNLILTDYLEFRHYLNGKLNRQVKIGTLDKSTGKIKLKASVVEEFQLLVDDFVANPIPSVVTSKELAQWMARYVRRLRDTIIEIFDKEKEKGPLHLQRETFRKTLLPVLEEEDFADLYAETVGYGLFAAWTKPESDTSFDRLHAADLLPKTNPFLKTLFSRLMSEMDDRVKGIADELVEFLNRADKTEILKGFIKPAEKSDPVIHFYEDFLAAYNPEKRERLGVYYTPEPVVDYIVRSIDQLLVDEFDRDLGLADESVYILDPGCGTGSFLYRAIQIIHERVNERMGAGTWPGYVREKLLHRLFGFEIQVAPYVIAHLKLGLLLQSEDYTFGENERLGIYLTNTLEPGEPPHIDIPFGEFITKEAKGATKVKSKEPIMVVLGNPPYSIHSANRSKIIIEERNKKGKPKKREVLTFIGKLLEDYYYVDGHRLRERNPKPLQNDYVKFLRFAQWRITKTGYGIVGMITNHGYEYNPVFSGMRQQLLQTFNKIYILDLHGNILRKERCPDGSIDENIFHIKDNGVSIGLFILDEKEEKTSEVSYAEFWGTREVKNKKLFENSMSSIEWEKLTPVSPEYLFQPRDKLLRSEFDQGWEITEIFLISSNGFKTHRDHFAVAFKRDTISRRINDLLDDSNSDDSLRERYNLSDTGGWNLSDARSLLKNDPMWGKMLVKCLFQPMDVRYCLYGDYIMDRSRKQMMYHALCPNLCMAVGRQGQAVGDNEWNLVTVGENVANTNLFYRGGIQYCPLYLYPPGKDTAYHRGDVIHEAMHRVKYDKQHGKFEGDLHSEQERVRTLIKDLFPEKLYRWPNLSPDFISEFSTTLGLDFIPEGSGDLNKTIGPEDIFYYINAILNSHSYRDRYSEFLKTRFPCIPLISNLELFSELVAKGQELVDLHLLKKVPKSTVRFPVPGDNKIKKIEWVESEEKVRINKDQYFEGIPRKVWEGFSIGGYFVPQQWFKERKRHKHTLNTDDIRHVQKMVTAIERTMELMEEIDKVIEDRGGWPLQGSIEPANS